MSSEGEVECTCVIDCAGLHAIACDMSHNLKTQFLHYLATGEIGVPACVWQEYHDAYEDEADQLAKHVGRKIGLRKKAYQLSAASIGDSIGAGFSMSPYDRKSDIYAASIASVEGYTLLTIESQVSDFKKMGCDVAELNEWIAAKAYA
jgi:hypothetical protein